MRLEIRGDNEEESRFQRSSNEAEDKVQKVRKVPKVYKSAESSVLLGNTPTLNLSLTRQPN